MSRKKERRNNDLHEAIDDLAGMYDCGHLLASTCPADLLVMVVAELKVLRVLKDRWLAKVARVAAWKLAIPAEGDGHALGVGVRWSRHTLAQVLAILEEP